MAPLPFALPARGDYVQQILPRVCGRSKLPLYLLPPSVGAFVGLLLTMLLLVSCSFFLVHLLVRISYIRCCTNVDFKELPKVESTLVRISFVKR